MIKLSILVPRRSDLTLEEFRAHWKHIDCPPKLNQTCEPMSGNVVQVHSTGGTFEPVPCRALRWNSRNLVDKNRRTSKQSEQKTT